MTFIAHSLDIIRHTKFTGRGSRPSAPVRVLHLIETGGPGGAERMLLSLVGRLGEGYKSTVGLVRPGWLQAQVAASGVPHEMLNSGGSGDAGVLARLLRVVHERQIGLIHAHEFYMSAMGAAVSMLTGVPLVITVHGKSYYADKPRRLMIYRTAAKVAAKVVAVSKDLERFFSTSVKLSNRVQVVYNGINLEERAGAPGKCELRDELGVPRSALLLGSVGNLYPVKGHIHLIRAVGTLRDRWPQIHVVILGRGDQRDPLLAEAKALGIQERIHLAGYRDDALRLLRAMDIFVLPSLSEGMPLSLLEAMAAGLPSVATAVGGIPEVITDGETGLLVAPEDSAGLAQRLLPLLEDQELRGRMGRAGRLRVEERFSLDAMAAAYRQLYAEALGR